MGQIAPDFHLNLDILKNCREQIGLSLDEVRKKVASIEKIESGQKRPTYKQLDSLSDLYQVPRWVFISQTLPEAYQFEHKPFFRAFKDSEPFRDCKVRQLVAKVMRYRNLYIELLDDLGEPLDSFSQPSFDTQESITTFAKRARDWLFISEKSLSFQEWKDKVEQKGIFVFLTSKFKDWSHIDEKFRGLAIFDTAMPIIIINDSDSKKAQLFTLMHELGHILRQDTAIDGEHGHDSSLEKWCDQFAGEILMPESSDFWQDLSINELSDIERLAKQFQVSAYACLVRLKQLNKITPEHYFTLEKELKQQYNKQQEKLKNINGGQKRDRSKEVVQQFGSSFVRTVLTAMHHQEMTLHKAIKVLGLKRPEHLFALENIV